MSDLMNHIRHVLGLDPPSGSQSTSHVTAEEERSAAIERLADQTLRLARIDAEIETRRANKRRAQR